jgi:two-component system, OmpR family, response regulator
MIQVLTIEDDAATAAEIAFELGSHGMQVTTCGQGQEGLELALRGGFDLITLDRMLPGLDGLSLVKRLRDAGQTTPVLMISALSDVDERVKGLRAGGDDYLTKPFDLGELSARVEVLLRRHSAPQATQLTVGDLTVDLIKRQAHRAGQPLSLMAKEFQLLVFLMRNVGQVLPKRLLLEGVWNLHFDPSTNLIEVHIGRLRKKVDLPGMVPLIQTVRGSGYRLALPNSTPPDDTA